VEKLKIKIEIKIIEKDVYSVSDTGDLAKKVEPMTFWLLVQML